ncbi:MAG TPA: tetratricopeptide repeat protein [Bacteroidetes bacterium]|nr:tetratricopeptide repeat protein [Bacteroidota bacterium]
MKTTFLSLLILVFIISCNNNHGVIPDEIVKMEKDIKSSPSDKSFLDLNNKYKELLKNNRLSDEERKEILSRAYKFFMDSGKDSYALTYLTELIKDFPGEQSMKWIKDMVSVFDKKGSSELSLLMKKLYVKNFPDDKESFTDVRSGIDSIDFDFDKYLKGEGEKIFADLETTGKLNVKAAKDYVNDCEAFVLIAPADSLSPEYLFKAGEVAHTIKSYNKTFELYDWILDKYAGYKKTPTALFLKGYILDNELKKYDDAKKIYNQFLQKYPNSELVDDVKTLIKYMGKSDEEILKMIEENKGKQGN